MLIRFYGLVSGDLYGNIVIIIKAYHAVQWLLLITPNKKLPFDIKVFMSQKILFAKTYFWCLRTDFKYLQTFNTLHYELFTKNTQYIKQSLSLQKANLGITKSKINFLKHTKNENTHLVAKMKLIVGVHLKQFSSPWPKRYDVRFFGC